MKVTIKSITAPNIVEYIAEFARVSRNRDSKESTTEQDLNRCKQLWRDGHHTAFECINIDFLIEDVSRSLLAQITRYRIATYNVLSQRYVSYAEKDIDFVLPDSVKNSCVMANQELNVDSLLSYCQDMYSALVGSGVKPEDARCVLPNATPTRFRVVMNLRSFFNFYKQRSDAHAQQEIRDLAEAMFLRLIEEVKNICDMEFLDFIKRSFKHTLKDLIKELRSIYAADETTSFDKVLKEYSDFV